MLATVSQFVSEVLAFRMHPAGSEIRLKAPVLRSRAKVSMASPEPVYTNLPSELMVIPMTSRSPVVVVGQEVPEGDLTSLMHELGLGRGVSVPVWLSRENSAMVLPMNELTYMFLPS